MSGGPPPTSHHSHTRQVPPASAAWNHLQVPNYFPGRQPQHAHMSNEHPIIHQPTWHTPTTEPLKSPLPSSHLFNLEQMLSERPFARQSPGVDLSITRNGNQNGDLPTPPISLSVRDTNKINSLPASALDIQGTELKSLSPGLNSLSPGLKSLSPGLKSLSPDLKSISPTILKSPMSPSLKSISPSLIKSTSPGLKSASPGLLSINHSLLKMTSLKVATETTNVLSPLLISTQGVTTEKQQASPKQSLKKGKRVDLILERLNPQVHDELEKASVIVQTGSSHDENSNSSSIVNVPTPSTIREDEVVSPYSNEDSLDSNKSRRKRKPSKTIRLTKETEVSIVAETKDGPEEVENEKKIPERRKSESPEPASCTIRRKSSESETIDKIAAMVQETAAKKEDTKSEIELEAIPSVAVTTIVPKKDFIEVENKLEEMFAGLEDPKTPVAVVNADNSKVGFEDTRELLGLENTPSTSHDNVTSTSSEIILIKRTQKKRKMTSKKSTGNSSSSEGKGKKRSKMDMPKKSSIKKANGKMKMDVVKDVYAYDSGSNASSSRSRGPFVHIRGPRDSPVSVSVINTPISEEDPERKPIKIKKFHDDTEYRHKVRSKGLHCSTLSNKYDAQTKDTSWICVFCKRGPYSSDFTKGDKFYTPGDLFGPYVITNTCSEYERRLDDPYDKHFKSKKVQRIIEGAGVLSKQKRSKLRKSSDISFSEEEFAGITKMDERNYEVWAHEDCVIWSAGIYLIGAKIVGLEEGVWTCSNVSCTRCHMKGANICCLRRGCARVVHLGCAVVSNWQLDENNYKAFCMEHHVNV